LVIFLLAGLAIFQTSQLWFVYITDRRLTTYFAAFFNPTAPDGYNLLVRPMRVLAGNGDGRFDIDYGGWSTMAEAAFSDALRTVSFRGMTPAADARESMAQEAVIMYQYAFPLRAEVFDHLFARRNATPLYDHGVTHFDAVAVTADRVVFLGEEWAWTFALPDLIPLPLVMVRPYPQVQGTLAVANPYSSRRAGMVQLDSFNAQVGHWFDNPATRNPRLAADNLFTVSTLNTVVRMLPGHVVEVSHFHPIRRGGTPDFVADFSAAYAFVASDPHITNPVYLAGYEARGRTHVFWFNYLIEENGRYFPLLVPEGGWGSASEPMPFPIEVIADHGHVTRYRRLAYQFTLVPAGGAR